MNDTQIINDAYADAVRKLFAIFSDVTIIAKNAGERTLAEQRFQAGVQKAREIRDRAITLLS